MNINITDPIFHDEAKAKAHLEADRWPNEVSCPLCESTGVTRMGGKTQAGMFLCNVCRQKFTVRTGTVMERSHVPLHKWLLATHLMAASKKGVSAHQLHRMLGVTYKTAWFLAHRIREAMDEANNPHEPLGGPVKTVESDEAFVGGFKKKRLSGKVAPKKKIVTLVERGGRARSFHITHIDHTNVRGAIVTNVHRSSHLMTDDARFYNRIGQEFASHKTTLHANREFSRGDGHHSNTAENFFSIFKRGVVGVYHHMSATHMHRYLAEFDLRYSTKNISDGERANAIIKGMVGRRLTYRRTNAIAA
jgi:transposase-like protein